MSSAALLYEDVNSPAYQSPAYRAQLPALRIVQDCFEGTQAIKRGGQLYLPKGEREKDLSYSIRLARSTFWNAYRRTVMGLVGMISRKGPILQADVPALLKDQMENCDLMRSRIDVFAKEVAKWSIAEGHSAILVDMPPSVAGLPGATFADELRMRPYFSLYRKAQIVNWRFEDNKLTRVTLAEHVDRPDGAFGEKCIERFRVLYVGGWELFEMGSGDKANLVGSGEFKTIGTGSRSLNEIPLVIVAADKDAHMTSKPPLLDLAFENRRHYRLQSDLDHILHVVNVPILVEEEGSDGAGLDGQLAAGKLNEGAGKKPERVISPNTIYGVAHGGSLKYVEHTGSAIGKAQEEIKTTRSNMATLGLSFIASAPEVSSTATENALEYENETSELAGMAGSLEDGLELGLAFSARFQGIGDDGGSVKIGKDFTRYTIDGRMIAGLALLVQNQDLSLETMYGVLQCDLLGPDFQAKDELGRLLAEAKLLGKMRPRPGGAAG